MRVIIYTALLSTLALTGCDPIAEKQESKSFSEILSVPDRYIVINDVGEFPDKFPAPQYNRIKLEKAVLVPMRDGVRLSTDIYTPVDAKGPFPVIQIRLPYNKNRYMNFRKPGSIPYFYAGHGYAVIVQDMRGRFESEGEYTIFSHDRVDGYDTVEWISKQPWSTGKVGTYGCSYLGENQILLSATRHPNHLAALPQSASGGYIGRHRPFGAFDGGVMSLAPSLGWFWSAGTKIFLKRPDHMSDELFRSMSGNFDPMPRPAELNMEEAFHYLPVIDVLAHYGSPPTDFENFVSHGVGDKAYWKRHNMVDQDDHFDVPALHVNGWYDYGANGTMDLFNLFRENGESKRAANNQFAIISPFDHCASESQMSENSVVGKREMGDTRLDYFKIYLDWFDHWLKGIDNGVTERPKIQYYLMGANDWRTADQWPLKNTQFTNFYLHSAGRANSLNGDGVLNMQEPVLPELSDNFVYDPENPVPTVGGPICCINEDAAAAGSYDQRENERRQDILVYTSVALQKPLEVTGPLKAVLYVSSSAKDTDFTVKLVDVYPDGTAYNIQESILRARYREGYDKKIFMEEGGIYKLEIDFHATGNQFGAGHKIRLEVSSSNFPAFIRNLNTGGNNYDETEGVTAHNVIHHSKEYPSHIILPVIPGE